LAAPNSSGDTEQTTLSGLREAEAALADPLKAETRKARLYLLGVSMVSISIVWTGLVPQEIATLGITFGQANQRAILVVLSLVVIYFLGAFAVYGAADLLASRYAYANAVWVGQERAYQDYLKLIEEAKAELEEKRTKFDAANRALEEVSAEEMRTRYLDVRTAESRVDYLSQQLPEPGLGRKLPSRVGLYSTLAPWVSVARQLFEFLLPLLVGGYAIYALLFA
jgi:hypothetical protein